uniref:Serum amyloid A protein n=1 Tax=Rhipicephalus appendiculatus TaxID=34631 RepID=A0A131Z5D7_RHIAP
MGQSRAERFRWRGLALVLLLVCHEAEGAATRRRYFNWRGFLQCIDNRSWMLLSLDGACVALIMYATYRTMLNLECPNCDLYFHCRANYNALRWCRKTKRSKEMNALIGGCQNLSKPGRTPEQKAAEERARQDGREQKNCASMYLAKAGCSYNPDTRKCMALQKI